MQLSTDMAVDEGSIKKIMSVARLAGRRSGKIK